MGEPGRSKSGATLASTATTILRRPGMRALAPIALGLLVGSAIARPAEAQVARVAVARVAVARVAVRAREPDVVVARRLRERLAALDVAVEPAEWDAEVPPWVSLDVRLEGGGGRVCVPAGPCDEAVAPTEAELLVDLVEIVRARLRDAPVVEAPPGPAVPEPPAALPLVSPEPVVPEPPPTSAEPGVELRLAVSFTAAIPTVELLPDVELGGTFAVLPVPWLEVALRLDGALYAHRPEGATAASVVTQSLAIGAGIVPVREGPFELAVRLEGGAMRLVDHGVETSGAAAQEEHLLPLGALVIRAAAWLGEGFGLALEVGGRVVMETTTTSATYGPVLVDLRLSVLHRDFP